MVSGVVQPGSLVGTASTAIRPRCPVAQDGPGERTADRRGRPMPATMRPPGGIAGPAGPALSTLKQRGPAAGRVARRMFVDLAAENRSRRRSPGPVVVVAGARQNLMASVGQGHAGGRYARAVGEDVGPPPIVTPLARGRRRPSMWVVWLPTRAPGAEDAVAQLASWVRSRRPLEHPRPARSSCPPPTRTLSPSTARLADAGVAGLSGSPRPHARRRHHPGRLRRRVPPQRRGSLSPRSSPTARLDVAPPRDVENVACQVAVGGCRCPASSPHRRSRRARSPHQPPGTRRARSRRWCPGGISFEDCRASST